MNPPASLADCVNRAWRSLIMHQIRLNFTDDAHIPWLMKAIFVLAHIFLRHLIDVLVGTFFRNVHDMSSHREPMPLIGGVDNIKTYLWPLFHVQRFLSPFERIDQDVGAIKFNPDRGYL